MVIKYSSGPPHLISLGDLLLSPNRPLNKDLNSCPATVASFEWIRHRQALMITLEAAVPWEESVFKRY
jgi:hypothetical protein